MAIEPVKSNLFRFVTLRNPELISGKANEESLGFVRHPRVQNSVFYSAVDGVSNEQKTSVLENEIDSFSSSAFKTRLDVRSEHASLYDFSFWLMRNRNALSYAAIISNISGVSELSTNKEDSIWDNLLYQTISKKTVYVREACIQVLIANQFYKAFDLFSRDLSPEYVFTEEELTEFIRRANASVVISRSLFYKEEVEVTPKFKKENTEMLNLLDKNKFEYDLLQYELLEQELKEVEKEYNRDFKAAYETALDIHNKDVKAIVDKAVPEIVERVDELGNRIKFEKYPKLDLPEFNFDFNTPLDKTYFIDKVSETALNVITANKLDQYSDFSPIYKDLGLLKKQAHQNLYKTKENLKPKVYQFRGNIFKSKSTQTLNPYCFSGKYEKFASGEMGINVIMSTDQSVITVSSATFQLENLSTNTVYDGQGVINVGSNNNTLGVLFVLPPVFLIIGQNFKFSGEFTLSNGDTYSFEDTGIVVRDRIRRNLLLAFETCSTLVGGDPTTPDPVTPIEDRPIYGITNLGIADFRRVEQEVCCYVPGEVSHIDNIMAREYKERSTRSLTSSETTVERTEEKEKENLTDTSTTERNEMQSEVSSVLNEDQSQNVGASAFVSGGGPGKLQWGVNGYADFSSSTSSSVSNLQASTYAQEVTERAMERIVQKVQTKRTSRILKEFEENNTHGFDNREGTDNITGVYRWVDKKYTNRLINYGKRLIYEFALPEPSRFLKDAIVKEIEQGNNTSAVMLPKKPDDFPYNSSEDVDEFNYMNEAAKYGAEVRPAPDNEIVFSKAISISSGVDDSNEFKEKMTFEEDLELPEGYRTLNAEVNIRVPIEGNKGGCLIVGTKKFNLIAYTGFPSIQQAYLKPYTKRIPVSFSSLGYNIVNIGIALECERTDEFYQQWQIETYNAIMEAYLERVREYNEAVQNQEVIPEGETETMRFNPLENRAIEKRELKRLAIELLAGQKNHKTSRNNYTNPNVAGIEKMKADADFQQHAQTVKFFEQAFDWEIMSYIFYPYFYGDESNWKDLFQKQEPADYIFQAFLQSGMARAIIPVREGFEYAVMWYMETGELWNGQDMIADTENELYVSIDEELRAPKIEVVEDTWETRLPTSLTIIQAQSAALDEGGLPCFCPDENTNIKPDEATLSGRNDTGGVGEFVVS
jgi:hypothetical protein